MTKSRLHWWCVQEVMTKSKIRLLLRASLYLLLCLREPYLSSNTRNGG